MGSIVLLSYVSIVWYNRAQKALREMDISFISECQKEFVVWTMVMNPYTAGALSLEYRSAHVITPTVLVCGFVFVFITWNPCYLTRHVAVICLSVLSSLSSERSVPNSTMLPVETCLLQCPTTLITLCREGPQAFMKPWLLSSWHCLRCPASCSQSTSCFLVPLCSVWVSCWMISHNEVFEHRKSII